MSGLNLYSRLYVYLPPRTRDKVYSRPRAGKGKVTLERGKTDGILLHYTFKAHMRKREKMITGHPPFRVLEGCRSEAEAGKFICRYPSKWILTRKINENLIK